MLRARILAVLLALAATAAAQQPPGTAAAQPAQPEKPQYCSETRKELPSCNLPKHDARTAANAYREAVKLAGHNELEAAMEQIERALKLSPQNSDYLGTRELLRQRLVEKWLQRGGQESAAGNEVEALAAFREVLEYDPTNASAIERIQSALPPLPETPPLTVERALSPAVLAPRTGMHDFKFTGRAGDALMLVAAAWGVEARVDDSVMGRVVTFKMEGADWSNAINTVCHLSHAMMVPLASDEVLFVGDSEENRRQFDRMVQRTFYVSGISAPQQLTDLSNVLRVMFELHDVSPHASENSISIRAPQSTMLAVTRFMEELEEGVPQVMLDIKVYQVSRNFTRHFGLTLPHQFTVFNIPSEAQKILGGQSLQSIINQLETGTLNLSSLSSGLDLSALQSSPLMQSFVTFGGGLTLTGITLSAAGTNLGASSSEVRDLQHVTIRASALQPAVVKIGERYPVVTARYSSAYTLPSSLGSLAALFGGSSTQPFASAYTPSVSFEDLGLSLKASPSVGQDGVRISFELQIRALSGSSVNGVPILSNREYTGTISAPDGGSIAIAGYLTEFEQRSLEGYSGLDSMPALNRLLGTSSLEKDGDEMLVIMTPHIVSSREMRGSAIRVPPAAPVTAAH